MMKLTKQSHKNYRVTLGKNQQEEKRLELRNKLLEKASYFEDNIWIRDFIKIKQSLNEINLNCDYANVNDSGRFQSLSASFTDPNRRRRVASSPAKKSTTTQQSSASLTLPSRSHLKSAPPLSMPPKSAPYSENCSINRTVTNLTNNKYFLSPGKIYKSYTSLVGPKFDRTKEELESFSIKNAFLDSFLGQSSMSKSRCLSGKSLAAGGGEDSLFNIEESYWHDDDLPLLVYSSGEEDEMTKKNVQINILNDPNERYKSIRRSQARSGSSKDILFQMKSLKSKTNFSLESNKKLYNFSDRTVRYGDPLPQRPLYRELRILSKFELTAAN